MGSDTLSGGKGENYSLEIGSNSFIPGFEDGVVGMKVDEEKDLNLTFPKDYGVPDLAGKDVVFKVKVNEIKTVQIPSSVKKIYSYAFAYCTSLNNLEIAYGVEQIEYPDQRSHRQYGKL